MGFFENLTETSVFVDAKVPVAHPVLFSWLEERGFHLVDTSLTFEKPIDQNNIDKVKAGECFV